MSVVGATDVQADARPGGHRPRPGPTGQRRPLSGHGGPGQDRPAWTMSMTSRTRTWSSRSTGNPSSPGWANMQCDRGPARTDRALLPVAPGEDHQQDIVFTAAHEIVPLRLRAGRRVQLRQLPGRLPDPHRPGLPDGQLQLGMPGASWGDSATARPQRRAHPAAVVQGHRRQVLQRPGRDRGRPAGLDGRRHQRVHRHRDQGRPPHSDHRLRPSPRSGRSGCRTMQKGRTGTSSLRLVRPDHAAQTSIDRFNADNSQKLILGIGREQDPGHDRQGRRDRSRRRCRRRWTPAIFAQIKDEAERLGEGVPGRQAGEPRGVAEIRSGLQSVRAGAGQAERDRPQGVGARPISGR